MASSGPLRGAGALVLVLALTLPLSGSAAARVRHPQDQCRTSEGNGWSTRDVKQVIRCAFGRYAPAQARKAISVARCESGFRPRAHDTPGVGGVFQHKYAYWHGRFRRWRVHGWHMRPSIYNARSNVVISARMVHAQGWGAWACA